MEKESMKKINKIAIIVLSVILTVTFTAMTYNNLRDIIYRNYTQSISYQLADIEAAINRNEAVLLQKNVLDINETTENLSNSITAIQAEKNAYEKSGNVIGVLNCEIKIQQLQDEIISLKISESESKLKADISKYESEFSAYIADENQRKIQHQFYEKCLSLFVYQSKLEYYEYLEKYLDNVCSAESEKLKLGYSTDLKVKKSELDYEIAKQEKTELKDAIEYLEGYIESQTYKNPVKIKNLNIDYKPLSENTIYKDFINSNTKLQYFDINIKSYDKYVLSLRNINADTDKIENAELHKKELQMKKEAYETDLKLYIKKLISTYETLTDKLALKEKEIDICKQNIKESEILLVKGGMSQLDYENIQIQEYMLNYEKNEILYDLNVTYNKIEKCIEN